MEGAVCEHECCNCFEYYEAPDPQDGITEKRCLLRKRPVRPNDICELWKGYENEEKRTQNPIGLCKTER